MAVNALLRCMNVSISPGWLPDADSDELKSAPQWIREAVERGDRGLSGNVTLQAIYDINPEGANREWATATPFAKLEMNIDNPAALRQFEPGVEYVVEIRKRTPSRARSESHPPV